MPPGSPRARSALAARIESRRRLRSSSSDARASVPDAPLPSRALVRLASHGLPPPDLLHATPVTTVDVEGLAEAFDFAFTAGDDGGAWDRALARAPIAASTWDPAHFAGDLFLAELVAIAFAPRPESGTPPIDQEQFLRHLSHPPSERATVELRRAILGELVAKAEARAAFATLHARLVELRELFRGAGVTVRGDLAERRLDLVKKLGAIFDALCDPAFASADSGLRRLADFGAAVRATDAYARLRELAEYDESRAHAELRVRLGADGRIRALEVLGVRENTGNRYHRSLLGRLLERLWLALRGYRLGAGEIAERWLDAVFAGVLPYVPPLAQLLGDVEFYAAGLAFRDACAARGLAVCFPELADDGETSADGLFNPLLFAQDIVPVPCALARPEGTRITLVTGPNSGGKTRLLQARGLLQLCAEVGLLVPAARARVRRASGLFASLIEEASVNQREGRLGMELVRIRTLFERAEPGYLVVVDELCSGTNPSEGDEMFRLVLELLGELDPEAYVSTHFLSFAASLEPEAAALRLAFRKVELDADLRPTYGFVPGVADTSLAHQTAARLGVTRDALMALVRRKRRD